jgi:hypothetical protein
MNYNITPINITNGLSDHEISGGKTYLILLDSPPLANVRVKLDSNTSDEIPLSNDYAIKFPEAKRIYISCDALEGEQIKIATSNNLNGAFEILPSPVVDSIEEVGALNDIGETLFSKLDKIVNPYELSETVLAKNTTGTDANYLIINNLDCDKIRLKHSIGNSGGNYYYSSIILIDGHAVSNCRSRLLGGSWLQVLNDEVELYGVRGKRLVMWGSNASCFLEKYNKKQ